MPFSSGIKQFATRNSTFWDWDPGQKIGNNSAACSVYHFHVDSSGFQAHGSGAPQIHSSRVTVSYIILSFRNTAPVWRTVGAKYQSPQTIVV